ncbi:hypothetical protein BK654_24475 [Pseudomonas brassicacearum]|uniref:hypothetical protein n=1 Tax=Pseudomonas brassicacearum TaxID=930166 RepID=UPI000F476672|nr:hypothetical protein [Pseudomonas brassicacearum]ROM72885.1 hypothetical protein BK654_24475 [Pseudomonas brassicacearum]
MTSSRHYFIDGFTPTKGLLGVVAFPYALKGEDTEYTTLYMTLDGQWMQQTFDFDSRSITHLIDGEYRAWWILGKRGEVVEIKQGPSSFELIADAGTGGKKLGYMNKITVIDGELYACGYNRQVYRRSNGTWMHMDQGLLYTGTKDGISLESMAGHSKRDIHAVGNAGEIWFFDGSRWRQCDSPTNVDLNEVATFDQDKYIACGDDGLVLVGSKDCWTVIQNDEVEGDLWGAVSFQDRLYVAGFEGIGIIDNNQVKKLAIPGVKKTDGYRLRTCGNYLWSIGNDQIMRFDGTHWAEIICPDNI